MWKENFDTSTLHPREGVIIARRRSISDAVRRAKNFRAHAGKFLCARKFISFRKEISPAAEGDLIPYIISN